MSFRTRNHCHTHKCYRKSLHHHYHAPPLTSSLKPLPDPLPLPLCIPSTEFKSTTSASISITVSITISITVSITTHTGCTTGKCFRPLTQRIRRRSGYLPCVCMFACICACVCIRVCVRGYRLVAGCLYAWGEEGIFGLIMLLLDTRGCICLFLPPLLCIEGGEKWGRFC